MKKPAAPLPPIGTLVRDTATGFVGVLKAVLRHESYASGREWTVAYLAHNEGGGRETEADPKNVTVVDSEEVT